MMPKRVTFALELNETFPTRGRRELSLRERNELFYSANEYKEIRAGMVKIVKEARSGSFVESQKQTFRGLERHTREAALRLRDVRTDATLVVLSYSQNRKRPFDPEQAKRAYQQVSKESVEESIAAGQRDQAEIQDELTLARLLHFKKIPSSRKSKYFLKGFNTLIRPMRNLGERMNAGAVA